jgi:hypothetical protein
MTDRELLELAAKAAGFDTIEWQDMEGWGEIRYGYSEAVWNGHNYWNPLHDDADALRLAVVLRLPLDYASMDGRTDFASVNIGDGDELWEPLAKDPCAAMRRVIVRAAAAIGESK